jgi:hypothetical protein
MADKTFNVSEADFSQIKTNLINYLKSQSSLSDYNFTGSSLNILLDILAYSNHYTAMHTNLAFNETFLDSAVQRGSVVSRAQELNYIPRSKTAAFAEVEISFSVSGNPDTYILPRGTIFQSSTSGTTLQFVTTESYTFENDGNNVYTGTILLYNGKFTTYTYTVDLTNTNQRFIIPSKDVDTQFLTVLIKDSIGSTEWTSVSYIRDLQIGDITSETNIYFLKETFDGFYEVYFGDGIIGKNIENGNVIQLNYIITDGEDGNNAQTFTLVSSLSSVSGVSITTTEISASGASQETVESIKYLAPFYYQAQGRAVTEDDYKVLLLNTYSNLDDVTVWGGEKNDPPFYGKVFIAAKPHAGEYISTVTKEFIKNDIISRYNVVGVRPEIVDPDLIEVSVDVVSTYNNKLYSTSSTIDLNSLITTAISDFFSNQVNKFGKPLYYSKLLNAIVDSSDLLLNTILNLSLTKSKEIFSGINGTYNFYFNNAIYPGSVISNAIVIDNTTWYIKDVPTTLTLPYTDGKLVIYRISGNTTIYYSEDAGTVDYNTGEIVLSNIKIDNILNDQVNKLLTFTVSMGSFADSENPNTVYIDQNVYTNERDQIITLKDGGITITLLPDESI